jgi:hypothetical protein
MNWDSKKLALAMTLCPGLIVAHIFVAVSVFGKPRRGGLSIATHASRLFFLFFCGVPCRSTSKVNGDVISFARIQINLAPRRRKTKKLYKRLGLFL